MRYFITGGAGFIGSNLTDRLLKKGNEVVVYDNFSTGFEESLEEAKKNTRFSLVRGDVLNKDFLISAMKKCNFVFHLAANADVRFGINHPSKDIEQNIITTFNVLEAMGKNKIKKIAFSSTGSIYGEAKIFPTPEDSPFPVQTSLYGASKLAGEGLIQAYCEGFGFSGWIFRFVSILGERYSHGHVLDFYKKLLDDPNHLHVLGNGKQRKSYLYVQDCIDAMLMAIEEKKNKVNIFNLGTDEFIIVDDSVNLICGYLGLNPKISYSGGDRGWIGDNPFIFLECSKIRSIGWRPRLTIKESVIKTLQFLEKEKWILRKRK